MDRYVYRHPKGYKWIKDTNNQRRLILPDLMPLCMCCKEHKGNDYYEAFDMVNSEYGYLCKTCVDKMEGSNANKKSRVR